jgi:hypothetical protein
MHTFATRNEGDVGCYLRVLGDKEREKRGERESNGHFEKKLQNKFCGSVE